MYLKRSALFLSLSLLLFCLSAISPYQLYSQQLSLEYSDLKESHGQTMQKWQEVLNELAPLPPGTMLEIPKEDLTNLAKSSMELSAAVLLLSSIVETQQMALEMQSENINVIIKSNENLAISNEAIAVDNKMIHQDHALLVKIVTILGISLGASLVTNAIVLF